MDKPPESPEEPLGSTGSAAAAGPVVPAESGAPAEPGDARPAPEPTESALEGAPPLPPPSPSAFPGTQSDVHHPPVALPEDASPRQVNPPTLGAGVGTGLIAAVVGLFLVVVTITSGMNSSFDPPSIWTILGIYFWPFIVLTIAGVLLMISRKWRRFGTGFLIVMAGTAIVVLGPCAGLLAGV